MASLVFAVDCALTKHGIRNAADSMIILLGTLWPFWVGLSRCDEYTAGQAENGYFSLPANSLYSNKTLEPHPQWMQELKFMLGVLKILYYNELESDPKIGWQEYAT